MGASVATACAPPGRCATWPAPTPVARPSRRTSRSRWRCRRSTASRCAAATRPACTSWSPATASTSPTRMARLLAAARRPAVHLRRGARRRRRPQLRLQGGRRDRRAGRQRRGAARRHRRRRPAAPGARGARRRRGDGARPHPLGQRRASSPRPTPTRSTPRRSSALDGARTSSPRSTATSTTTPTSGRRPACAIPAEITTDAKVIPALVSRRLADGARPDEAFRPTVAAFEGSVAIAASLGRDPDQLHLALRGSGQALYVGLAEDAFVVASEPYGLVEETHDATCAWTARPGDPTTRGQADRRPRRPRGRHARRHRAAWPTTAADLPVDGGRAGARPRSPPATSTGAGSPTSC